MTDWTLTPTDTMTIADSLAKDVAVAKSDALVIREGGDWSHVLPLRIDHTKIGADLYDYPLKVYLGASSGASLSDVTRVFDELQSDANRKKIRVTTITGAECYVEIDTWSDASETAWFYVRVPFVSSTVDTWLLLYYDRFHADNDTYVGDTASAPAMKVWERTLPCGMTNGSGIATECPISRVLTAPLTVNVTTEGTFDVTVPTGQQVTCTSGTAAVTDSPKVLTADGSITVVGTGTITFQVGGYVAVYHMNDNPADSTKILDSTANGNTGTKGAGAAAPAEVAGSVGRAQQFVAANSQQISLPLGKASLELASGSILVLATNSGMDGKRLFNINKLGNAVDLYGVSGKAELFTYRGSVVKGTPRTTSNVGDGVAHTIAGTWGASGADILFDGALEEHDATASVMDLSSYTQCFIGRYSGPGNYFYNGLIDELRLASVARPAEWNAAEDYDLRLDTLIYWGEYENGGVAKAMGKLQADTVAITDAHVKAAGLAKADTFGMTDTLAKAVAKAQADTLAVTDAIAKAVSKAVADTVAIADVFARAVDYRRDFSDTQLITDAPVKAVGKAQADAVTIADAGEKAIGKAQAETMTITDAVVKDIGIYKADAMTISDLIAKALGMPLTDTLVITDSVAKAVGIILTETMLIADAVVKSMGIGEADTLVITDAIAKHMTKALADAMAIVDSMVMTGTYARPGIQVAAFLFSRAINALLYPRDINAKHRREF